MKFQKNQAIPLAVCSYCHGRGYLHNRKCHVCKSFAFGSYLGDDFYYFGKPISKYSVELDKKRRNLERFRFVLAFFGFTTSIVVFFVFLYQKELFEDMFALDFWIESSENFFAFFWVAFFFLFYAVYRGVVDTEKFAPIGKIDSEVNEDIMRNFHWDEVHKLPRSKKKDISKYFTKEASAVLEDAVLLADKYCYAEVTPLFFFHALLSSRKIQNIFVRLGLPAKELQKIIENSLVKGEKECSPVFSEDAFQIIFGSFRLAAERKDAFVHVTELLLLTVKNSVFLQEFLYDLGIDENKLTNVLEWLRIQERLSDEYHKMLRKGSTRNKHGLDRAMTAIATPFLNKFSRDITHLARVGALDACVAREKEMEELFRIMETSGQNVLLVGEYGVGKMSIIEGIAQKMVEEKVPEPLQDKRLMQLSVSSLLSGTTMSGAQERLLRIMREVQRAGNIILFIPNIHDLIGSEGVGAFDISKTLAEVLGSSRQRIFATASKEGYSRSFLHSDIGKFFTALNIEEMDENQAIQALESKTALTEYRQKVFFSYEALETAVGLSKRYSQDQNLPESAIKLMEEAAIFTRNKRGENTFVSKNDVAEVMSQRTGITLTEVSESESEKLLSLEKALHKRVIGQDRAVSLVSNALRRARVDIRSGARPIANFLFVGPTGVGKTELTKALAAEYFGNESNMIRFDMSEYQDKSSIYRLIGQPGQKGTGLLTESVRQKPFSLLLLDELEKADTDVLNLFLQVFDDGHITDSIGRKIDFTNTIIIATSNAGTSYVQEQLNLGRNLEEIENEIIQGELQKYYRPEFLNRFDGVVLFKPLAKEEIRQIAVLMLTFQAKRLEEERGLIFEFTDRGLDRLVEAGYNPAFGARPMRRAVQDLVENSLADILLRGGVDRRDRIVFDDSLRVEKGY